LIVMAPAPTCNHKAPIVVNHRQHPITSERVAMPIDNEGGGGQALCNGVSVRRLTPRECERLQGFPDDYTLVEYRSKPAADTPRYKALGNSMAVNVMSWLGQRIKKHA